MFNLKLMAVKSLKIIQSLKDGYKVLKVSPQIFLPALIIALLSIYTGYYMGFISQEFGLELLKTPNITEKVKTLFGVIGNLTGLIVISLLVQTFITGIIIKLSHDTLKRKASLKAAVKFMVSRYLTDRYLILLIASAVFPFFIFLGLIVFIVPGIYLMFRLLFYQYTIVIDNEDVVGSFRKSWKSTKGNWWRVFGLYLLILVIVMAVGAVLGTVGVFLDELWASSLTNFIISLFIVPWILASFTSAYLQIRK